MKSCVVLFLAVGVTAFGQTNEITVIPQGCDKLTGRPILRGPVFDFPVMCV